MMKKPICFLALLFILFSCDEHLRFEQAQPAGFPELSKIPKKLRGTYQDGDSTFLVIDKKTITELSTGTFSESLEEIAKDMQEDEEDVVIKDSTRHGFTVYAKDENVMVEIKFNKTSGVGKFEWREQRFSISPENVIKSKSGAYYVNIYRTKDTAWILRKLVIEGDSLFTYKVKEPKERAELAALTEVKDHYKKDGELEGWKIDPTSDMLDILFDTYGKKVKGYRKIK